jgi:hypothetical protein
LAHAESSSATFEADPAPPLQRATRSRTSSIIRQEVAVEPAEPTHETFNPWSIVDLVFEHLAREGLHPTLGEGGDPGARAAELLKCLGITPAAEGNRHVATKVQDRLAELRDAVFGDG